MSAPTHECQRVTRGIVIFGIALACLPLLGACRGDYVPPVVASPESWGPEPKNVPSHTIDGDPVDMLWWRSFRDPELIDLVDRLGSQNLDLKTAAEHVIQSAAQTRIAAAQGLPQVDGSAQNNYNRLSPNGNPLSLVQSRPGAPIQFPVFQEGLTASWELDLFGRVRHAVEAGDAQTLASIENRHGVALAALAELAQSYLQLRGVQTRIAIAKANLAIAGRNVSLVESRYHNGYATTLDLAQARAQQATVAASLPPLLAQEAQLINAIGLLFGQAPRAMEGELRSPRAPPHVPRTIPISVPGTLVRRRPDVREAEARLHAATANTGVAIANFYPTVNLVGGLNVQSLHVSNLFELASVAYNVGPTITVPIFEGGRLKANLELSQSQQREAAIAFQKTVLQAWQQVDDALTAYAQAQRRRTDVAREVAQNKIALEASRQRYEQGLVDFLNVNSAQVQLLQSENDLADADTQITVDLVQLYSALGGGWEISEAPGVAVQRPRVVGPPGAIPTLLDLQP